MKKTIYIIIFLIFLTSCKEKIQPNRVDIKQINDDGSNNEKFIFRKEIIKEKWRKNRYKKEKF